MTIGEMILHLEIEAGKNKVAMADIINNKMIKHLNNHLNEINVSV